MEFSLLGKTCDFISGVTFKPEDVSIQPEKGYAPILRAGNLQDELLISEDLIWVPESRISKDQFLNQGDIAICMSSGSASVVGKTAYVPKQYHGSVGAFCGIIRPKEKKDSEFIYYWSKSDEFLKWRDIQAKGANIQNLKFSQFGEIPLYFPDPDKRASISATLRQADRTRKLRRYSLQLSQSFLQSVFLQMFGDLSSNLKGWEIKKISQVISSIRYGTGSPPVYSPVGIPFIRATNVKKSTIIHEGMVYISQEESEKIPKCQVKSGNLILVRSGANVGDCALIPSEFDHAFAAYDLIIEVANPVNIFLNTIFNSDFGKSVIDSLSRRAGQPHINAEQVKSIEIPIPSKEIMDRFAKIYQENKNNERILVESSHQSELLFQSLLHRAFTGQL